MPPIPHRFAGRVALESFSLVGVHNLMSWLMHDLCPLDVSHLKTFSTGMGTEAEEFLRSQKFAPALRTIEAFDVVTQSTSWQSALDTLSTLPDSSHVRKIVILTVDTIPSFCAQLESKVMSLAVRPLPMLELETPSQAGASMESLDEYFPQLASRNLSNELMSGRGFDDGGHWPGYHGRRVAQIEYTVRARKRGRSWTNILPEEGSQRCTGGSSWVAVSRAWVDREQRLHMGAGGLPGTARRENEDVSERACVRRGLENWSSQRAP
ncbi:hypothetical protein FB451DRAFT_1364536 [Mycena latifolia]|nr:hypothetical protein FB451DRAFT_1364536 [Mycena latifolia]